MTDLSFLDIAALLLMLVSVLGAVRRGLTGELISLASVVGGVILALFFYSRLSPLVSALGAPPLAADFVSFLSLFLLTIVAGSLILRWGDSALRALHLKWIDRVLGGGFGLIRGWLINVVVFASLTAFSVGGHLVERSRLAGLFLTSAQVLAALSPAGFQEKFRSGYARVYRVWVEEARRDHDDR